MTNRPATLWIVVGLALAALPAACGPSGGNAHKASPVITLPPVFAAAPGLEWMRLANPEAFAAQGAAAPTADLLKERLFVAEPMGPSWYLLVRNDPEGRCDLGGDARPAKADAQASPDGVVLTLDAPAASRRSLADFSQRNLGRAVALTIDGLIYSAPNLQSKLSAAVQVTMPAGEIDRARALADRLARGVTGLSLRAVVQPGENPDEADLRGKFQHTASGAAFKKK